MLSRQNNVEFALVSESQGRVVIPEPKNYEDGNGNIYERDKTSKGFLNSRSNTLEFFGEAKDFFITQSATKGIAEDVVMEKKIKSDNRKDERWRPVPPIFLDMGEVSRKDSVIKTKAIQGGLFKKLKSKQGSKFDLTDNTSIKGVDIGSLKTVNIPIDGKEIELKSKLYVEDGTRILAVVSGGDNLNARSIPFVVEENSDRNDISSTLGNQLSAASGNYVQLSSDKVGNTFYTNADQTTTLFLTGRVEIRIAVPNSGSLTLDLVKYKNGLDFDISQIINLDSTNPSVTGNIASFDFDNHQVNIEKGDSLAIGVLSNTSDGVHYDVYNTALEIREHSSYPRTNCRAMRPFDIAERLVAKISGRNNCFKSSMLDEGGTHELKLITQGFWVRQFPDIVNEGTEEERRIQFKTSLKEFLEHLEAIEPIAWWVEKDGDKEVMRVEPLKYTQQNFVRIKYGETTDRFRYIQAFDIKRKDLKGNYYSKLEFGSKKGGEKYEEVSGLQSVSGKAEWSTINVGNDAVYSRLSPYTFGDVDVELERRRQFTNYPDEDRSNDSQLMCLDAKKIGFNYYLKNWNDSFEVAPKNIYRVDSAFNLEFTPARFLLNHSYVFNMGLYHYPNESLHFDSSNCNSSFTSKKTGELELIEKAPIPYSRLEKPRVKARTVDLTLKVEQELEDMITGSTDGVPNWFGLVAVDTGARIEYMRLVRVDTNKEGKHKLIEAFI